MRVRIPNEVSYSKGDTYRFRLEKDLTVQFPEFDFGRHRFEDDQGREWLSLQGHSWTLRKGYATDGASPKFKVGSAWIGTPDPEPSIIATFLHDSGYQFLNVPCFPLDRKQVDQIFLAVMRAKGFSFAPLYYNAVRLFGGLFASRSKLDTGLKCTTCASGLRNKA